MNAAASSHEKPMKTSPLTLRKVGSTITIRSQEYIAEGDEFYDYDQFRVMLGGVYGEQDDDQEGQVPRNVKTVSYVQRWRRNVDFVGDIGLPGSPLIATDFPSSPVAVIHPSSLRISSHPPYDNAAISRLAMASSPELASPTMIDKPTHFYDLYDAELERMIDEEASEFQESSTTSSNETISVYVPPVIALPPQKSKTGLKSAIRWLPTRIKYSFLSTAAGRSLRRSS